MEVTSIVSDLFCNVGYGETKNYLKQLSPGAIQTKHVTYATWHIPRDLDRVAYTAWLTIVNMVELEQLNIHSSRDIIARHGLTLPELFALSLEFYKEGSCYLFVERLFDPF